MHVGVGLQPPTTSPTICSRHNDHEFLDTLDEAHARLFAANQGYDLIDDTGMLTDWWGYCWMILAEARGLLTSEIKARSRLAKEEKYLSAPNVIARDRRTLSAATPTFEGSVQFRARARFDGACISRRRIA